MHEFLLRVKEWNKVVLFDFGLCQNEMIASDPQETLLEELPDVCDGILVSNHSLAEYFTKKGYTVFLNPLSLDKRMVEYAMWSTFDRDVLPFRNPKYMSEDELINYNRALAVQRKRAEGGLRIGFMGGGFQSGSFLQIENCIRQLLQEYSGLVLVIDGYESDLPEKFVEFQNQIVFKRRVDREDVFRIYAEIDILLVSLDNAMQQQDSLIQEWIYASLVKTPCVIYADEFVDDAVWNAQNPYYCTEQETLLQQLKLLIDNQELRQMLRQQNYELVRKQHTSVYTGDRFAQYVRGKMKPNIGFVSSERDLGGSRWPLLHHAALMQKEGYDVTVLVQGKNQTNIIFDDSLLPVVSRDLTYAHQYVEQLIAADAEAIRWIQNYTNVDQRFYLVQGFETDYYKDGSVAKLQTNQMS
jgi:hypothetical protein